MLTSDRDDFIAAHKRGPGILLWIAWVLVTAVSSLIGVSVSNTLLDNLHLEGPLIVAPVVSGIIMSSAIIGIGQGLTLLHYLKIRGLIEWALATIIGRSVQLIAASLALGAVMQTASSHHPSGSYSPVEVDNVPFSLILTFGADISSAWGILLLMTLIGGIAGTATGFAQQRILSSRVLNSSWWVFANAASYAAYVGYGALVWLHGPNFDLRGGLVSGIITGAITGIVLLDLLRHPTAQARWTLKTKREKPVRATFDPGTQPSPEALLDIMRSER